MSKRRKYNEEFKREAVKQLELRGDRSVRDVAEALGVAENLLYSWRKTYTDVSATVRAERGETADEELKRLRREVHQLRRDKEILKKATVFFAKETS